MKSERLSYSEKLKDPRWQRKRLEVFQRDDFKCRACGNATATLHVHHRIYRGEPWESRLDDLETVCSQCHELVTVIWQQPFLQGVKRSISARDVVAAALLANEEGERHQRDWVADLVLLALLDDEGERLANEK